MPTKLAKRLIPTAALVSAVLLSSTSVVFAATDGTDGTSSNGSSGITLSIPSLVRLAGITNLNLGTWSGSGDEQADQDVCVYTNVSAGTYQTSALGDGTLGAFTLANGGNTLPYSLYWNDQTGTTGKAAVTSGTVLENQSGADTTSSTCSTANANFQVVIAAADLAAVPSGAYTGVLSLTVEPD